MSRHKRSDQPPALWAEAVYRQYEGRSILTEFMSSIRYHYKQYRLRRISKTADGKLAEVAGALYQHNKYLRHMQRGNR